MKEILFLLWQIYRKPHLLICRKTAKWEVSFFLKTVMCDTIIRTSKQELIKAISCLYEMFQVIVTLLTDQPSKDFHDLQGGRSAKKPVSQIYYKNCEGPLQHSLTYTSYFYSNICMWKHGTQAEWDSGLSFHQI